MIRRLLPIHYTMQENGTDQARNRWFAEASQKGSDVNFVRSAGDTVDTAIVPRTREIAVGTLRSIVNHIEPADWDELSWLVDDAFVASARLGANCCRLRLALRAFGQPHADSEQHQ